MLENNIVLVLTILASVISLLGSMYDKVAKRKNLRLVLVLMFVVFSLATAKLVIDDIQKKNSAQLKKQIEIRRDMIAEEIRGNVQEGLKVGLEGLDISRKTITLLEGLKSQLTGKPLSTIGVKLTGLGTEEMHIFQKGNIYELKPFVTKVEGLLHDDRKSLPAISLTLNAQRYYVPGLIMAYTLANGKNVDNIFNLLKSGSERWETFPSDAFIKDYGPVDPLVKYVIFFDGNQNQLLGFADASMFMKEMLLYNQMGMYNRIEEILNVPGKATRETLSRFFRSFRPDVLIAADAYAVAKVMIDRNINETIAEYGNHYWLINLAKIVELAS
jgi:hypothetical protein